MIAHLVARAERRGDVEGTETGVITAGAICKTCSPIDRSRFGLGAAPLSRFPVCEPGEYRRSRESPLFPETPAGQFAFPSAGSNSRSWNPEQLGNLLQGEHLVAYIGSVRHLDSAYGKGARNGQPTFKEFTHQRLFAAPRRVGQAVEGRRLPSRQPHE